MLPGSFAALPETLYTLYASKSDIKTEKCKWIKMNESITESNQVLVNKIQTGNYPHRL